MSTTLTDIARQRVGDRLPATLLEATIVEPPFTDDLFLRVRVDSQPGYVRECPWVPAPGAAPGAGDGALVGESDEGNLWVVAWWNGEPDASGSSGGGGGAGNTILSGAGAPTAGTGDTGDFYINTTTHSIYGPKASSGWGSAVSLVGPEGPMGPPGTDGADGAPGPQGDPGPQGPKGDTGAQGPEGLQGPAGATGPKGDPGVQGPQGDTGAQGPQGATGAAGPAGLTWRGLWSASTAYAVNDAVTYLGASYRRLVAGTTAGDPRSDATNWAVVAGPAGEYAFKNGGWGPGITLAANAWKTVPLATAGGDDVTPAGAFTVNANGSITVRDAGRYQVNVAVLVQGGSTGWESASVGTTPDAQNFTLEMSQAGGNSGNFPILSASNVVNLSAGTTLYVTATSPNGGSAQIKSMSLHRVGAGPTGPVASVPQEAWHVVGGAGEPAFQNGWVTFGAPFANARFRKDPSGTVFLEGAVKSGTTDTMFTLPPGYRPATDQWCTSMAYVGGANLIPAFIRVNANGTVVSHPNNGVVEVHIDGIQFDTGQTTFPAGAAQPIVVVSALPSPGYDGQEVYFQTTAMATAGVAPWHLRYRATNPDGSANAYAFKWEPVGVCELLATTFAPEHMNNTSNVVADFATPCAITLPLSGEWLMESGASWQQDSNAQANLGISTNTGVNLVQGDAVIGIGYGAKLHIFPQRVGGRSTGEVIVLRGSTNAAGGTWLAKWLRVKPLRVA